MSHVPALLPPLEVRLLPPPTLMAPPHLFMGVILRGYVCAHHAIPRSTLFPIRARHAYFPLTGVCIGFEISGPGCATALHGVAHALGGLHTENEGAGALFRYMGIEN